MASFFAIFTSFFAIFCQLLDIFRAREPSSSEPNSNRKRAEPSRALKDQFGAEPDFLGSCASLIHTPLNFQRLEKREWRVYRREIKSWHGVKKCGRNFMRFCDKNRDRRITLDEWLECTECKYTVLCILYFMVSIYCN